MGLKNISVKYVQIAMGTPRIEYSYISRPSKASSPEVQLILSSTCRGARRSGNI